MYLKKNFFSLKKTYIFFFITVLFINLSTSDVKSSIFRVNDIEIEEPFETNFNKEQVIDKSFKNAFDQLIKMTVATNQIGKLKNVRISEIKNLIDSFNIKDEKFVQNSYFAKFEVNFNKQNTLLFFEKKNIFPSIPNKKDILILPILIDTEKNSVNLFNQNPFFNEWEKESKKYHLLNYILPTEDIDVINIINKNLNNLEEYNFEQIISKYDFDEYVVSLIYKDKDNYKVFSKIKIKNNVKIYSNTYKNINISQNESLNKLISEMKNTYEDIWKLDNQINRSVKLPINISISSKDYKKTIEFNNFLKNTELVYDFYIKDFNNKKLNYKIIFNGSPKQFLDIVKSNNINVDTNQQSWEIN
tara:strand:- start:327 stop:1403 length:1077 start_codon:yes stop_codon:yes gene_type:complete